MRVNYYSFPNPKPIPAGEVQVVDIARHLSFNRGAIVKYVARAGRKSPETELQDLEKARDHLNDEIEWVKARRSDRVKVATVRLTKEQIADDEPHMGDGDGWG